VEQQNWKTCDGYGNCWDQPCSGYAPEVRRGHFVSSDADTFAYSFSYGGVLVHDVSDLATALAEVKLPQPTWDQQSWYGVTGGGTSGGGAKPPVNGGGGVSVDPAPPTDGMEPQPDPVEPDPTPVEDGGVAPSMP
jgi:hypothetical protein